MLTPLEHGSTRGYQRGCRCDDCKAANATYKRDYNARQSAQRLRVEVIVKPMHPLDLRRPDWVERAACRGMTEVFFSEPGRNQLVTLAKQVCRDCPVQADCHQYALDNNEQFGIWSGKSPRELRRERLEHPMR